MDLAFAWLTSTASESQEEDAMMEQLLHALYALEHHGIYDPATVHWNLSTPALVEQVIIRREGRLAHLGPIVVRTGQHTGRAARDRYIVDEPTNHDQIAWGEVNQPMAEARFWGLHRRLMAHLQGRDLFVQDCFVGADRGYRLPVRIITENAWASLFARNIFIQAQAADELHQHEPTFTVIQAPSFFADSEEDSTRSDAFIVVNFAARLVLIGGTQYAGEIKKAIFCAASYLLAERGVLPLHSSASFGDRGDIALFLGQTCAGKTTLATDPLRTLIGDDEHGWSDNGVFSFEAGCYAKTLRLSPTAEPDIYEATRRFGTILENVGFDPTTGRIDLDDDSLTDNPRAAYPIAHIPHGTRSGVAGHPNAVILLVADAFGVLPLIARLTPEQAIYHFLSGYSSISACREGGALEPQAIFSACFGEPYMIRPVESFARMFGERINQHGVQVWLVNTGWSGGPCGVGERIQIATTRALVHAALEGGLDNTEMHRERHFGLSIPEHCPAAPDVVLDPRACWSDAAAYDAQAQRLAAIFIGNFRKYHAHVAPEIASAGPKLSDN